MIAGTISGLPSTGWAAVSGRDVLEAARAAGTLIPGRRQRPGFLAGCVVHGILSLFWTTLMALVWQRRPMDPLDGAAVGLAIAAFNLGVVGRRYPAIKALPAFPQCCDHMAFGALVAASLSHATAAKPGQRSRR